MNKYIDAEHFDARVREAMGMAMDDLPMEYQEAVQAILAMLKTEPAADVQEVRRGRWIKKYRGNYLCSVCGAWYRTTDDYGNIIDGEMTANYCESCGAKMEAAE